MKTKRKIRLFLVVLSVLLIISGCNAPVEVGEEIPVSAPALEPQPDPVALEIEEFFSKYVNTNERPIAVMIDNDDKNARPQAGLDEAYLVYELIVEGGSTRFMALFKGVNTEKIGPVRSSRHYFLDYVMENDAIYTHYGWSPKAIQDISAYGINKINGVLGEDNDVFWRELKFKGDWHSAYTSIEKIKAKISKKGFNAEISKKNGINYSESYIKLPEENEANEISLKYSGGYITGYTYNKETGMYEKSINGAPHTMQNGKTLEAKNIIIELIYDTSLGDGTDRRNINTTGSGKGYYITEGSFIEITRSKSSRGDKTVYKRADGTELQINPGKTIINIISPSSDIKIN